MASAPAKRLDPSANEYKPRGFVPPPTQEQQQQQQQQVQLEQVKQANQAWNQVAQRQTRSPVQAGASPPWQQPGHVALLAGQQHNQQHVQQHMQQQAPTGRPRGAPAGPAQSTHQPAWQSQAHLAHLAPAWQQHQQYQQHPQHQQIHEQQQNAEQWQRQHPIQWAVPAPGAWSAARPPAVAATPAQSSSRKGDEESAAAESAVHTEAELEVVRQRIRDDSFVASLWLCSIDVECVASGRSNSDRVVARVALVDAAERTLLDALVRPDVPVVSYLTPLTGLQPGSLEAAEPLSAVRARVLALLPPNALIVGQAIHKDLEWLDLRKGVHYAEHFDIGTLFRVQYPRTGRVRCFSLRHQVLHLSVSGVVCVIVCAHVTFLTGVPGLPRQWQRHPERRPQPCRGRRLFRAALSQVPHCKRHGARDRARHAAPRAGDRALLEKHA
jgi:hypothetical protein